MRGYGESSIPAEIEAYDVITLTRDLVRLLDDLGEERAVFVGHDWGANVAWSLALTEPERVEAVVGMSVPHAPRAPVPPLDVYRKRAGAGFYIVWLQQPGVADAALARDFRPTILPPQLWAPSRAGQEEAELRAPR